MDEEREYVDGEDSKVSQFLKNGNLLLGLVKRELLLRGNYHQLDYKCQSFKSFIHLIETNQMFKELKSDKQYLNEEKFKQNLNFKSV